MTEEVGPTPEEVAAAARLADYKISTIAQIVSHMNGVGASIKAAYPILEQDTWTIQKLEAEAVQRLDDLGSPSAAEIIAAAPLIARVCFWHHGEATDEARADQVRVKANIALGLSAMFLEVSAAVNGIRAAASDEIMEAQSEAEVYDLKSGAATRLEGVRQQYGV